MNTEIINIGDELLAGQTVNTNASWLAEQLYEIGFQTNYITVVKDHNKEIIGSLQNAFLRSDLTIITGGLGPTKDDTTKEAICEFFETKLIFIEEAYKNIEKIFNHKSRIISDLNRKQAFLPETCISLKNELGTAYGMWFNKNNKIFVSLPGVPSEMKRMFKKYLIPKLKEILPYPKNYQKTILIYGIAESDLAEKLEDWENSLPNFLSLSFLPESKVIKLKISGKMHKRAFLQQEITKEIKKIKNIIPEHHFEINDIKIEVLIGQLLRNQKASLSTAESCTGGYLAHLITSVSGSSDYYKGSAVCYSNDMKHKILDVKNETLIEFGAVSKEVVLEMANGVQKLFETDYAISTSGIAGPTGGSSEKPVGTIWIALSSKTNTISRKFILGQNRLENIKKGAICALNMLKLKLKDETSLKRV